MNRNIAIKAAMAAVLAVAFCSATLKDKVMTKEKGTYVINTTTLGKDIMGYNGATPLKVYVKKNKVVKVEALPNQETPKYWRAASSHLLEKWNGMTVDEAAEAEIDGRTGATFSSNAIKQNVQAALDYYKNHK